MAFEAEIEVEKCKNTKNVKFLVLSENSRPDEGDRDHNYCRNPDAS